MSPSQVALAESFVRLTNGQVTTTSTQIAESFGKRHDIVLRAIDNLECSPEFCLRNFAELSREVKTANGGKNTYREFTITRDGFSFLCMGFTGKEAAKWKEAYITAFNAMEAKLQAQPALPDPLSSAFLPADGRYIVEIRNGRAINPQLVPLDACVMTLPRLLKAINEEGAMMIETSVLSEFVTASVKRLAHRCEYYEEKDLKVRKAAKNNLNKIGATA